MQQFMADQLAARGYSVDHWKIEVDDIKDMRGFAPVEFVDYAEAFNVVGTLTPREVKGRSLIINGHIDVVPPCDADRWTTPPFEPRIEDGKMYGRGAGDMKSGLAAGIFAIEALKAAGYRPAAPVYLQSVVEEECTGNGALACIQRGYKADGALVPEPFGASIMRAEVGLIWACIDIEGDPQHASAAFKNVGANALEKAIHIWPFMKRLEAEWNARKVDHPVYRDHPHPIRVNLGKLSGGDWCPRSPRKRGWSCGLACSKARIWRVSVRKSRIVSLRPAPPIFIWRSTRRNWHFTALWPTAMCWSRARISRRRWVSRMRRSSARR